ncbi:hypothetical protein GCM10010400_40230 [Streptomyces aculeolatus]|uniref:glycine-rich domain-containing protein n=1 Tax=Streptomyces aculeolatus TaxID=270689 RepID=UPI001CEC86F3|nr:hypothetical protein [Streptomyces aculeolatus]
MTVLLEHVRTPESSARDLISPEAFRAVAQTVQQANPGMSANIAVAIVDEALKFVAACASSPTVPLRPSRVVDEGWHALILHTQIYTGLSRRLGTVVHHVPEAPDPARHDPDALMRTQRAIRDAGYVPNAELWRAPTDAAIPVAASCEHSEGGPEGSCTGSGEGDGPSGPNVG